LAKTDGVSGCVDASSGESDRSLAAQMPSGSAAVIILSDCQMPTSTAFTTCVTRATSPPQRDVVVVLSPVDRLLRRSAECAFGFSEAQDVSPPTPPDHGGTHPRVRVGVRDAVRPRAAAVDALGPVEQRAHLPALQLFDGLGQRRLRPQTRGTMRCE
jgi:hypothetical protein